MAIWGKLDIEQPLVHSFIAIILNRARPRTFILKIYCVYCNKATYAHFKTKQNKSSWEQPQPMADGSWSEMSQLPAPLDEKTLRHEFHTVPQTFPTGLRPRHPV